MQRIAGWAVASLAIGLLIVAGVAEAQMGKDTFAEGIVSQDGVIRVPENFREDLVMLGVWSVADDVDSGGEVGLHVVYAPRPAVEAYRMTGTFPDGTTLVKDLFDTETESLTTGAASRASNHVGTFVMVKDAKGRFSGNPLWGDGWGWAFFEAGDPRHTTSTDYEADCLGCHEPARASDLVYVQAYPVLK